MRHRRRHVASKFSRVQKSSNLDPKKTFLCFFLLHCVYKSIKKFRHNIVHFSLLKTITISECLKIVFDAFFFSSVFNFRLFLPALEKLFFPARQPWWHVHIGLVLQLVLSCITFLCTHGGGYLLASLLAVFVPTPFLR